MISFYPRDVMGRNSETQLHVCKKCNCMYNALRVEIIHFFEAGIVNTILRSLKIYILQLELFDSLRTKYFTNFSSLLLGTAYGR